MIALDTNAVIRLLVEDDENQASAVRRLLRSTETSGGAILILSEVVLETVWVLESVYRCSRADVVCYLDALLAVSVVRLPDGDSIRSALGHYRKSGDFADHLIVSQAQKHQASGIFSFDRQLQQQHPDLVSSDLTSFQ
jgi:predicted nucleic-acid-binding protein